MLFPPGDKAAVISTVLTDGCSTGSTGVASAIQTTQSSRGSLSNLQLQDREEINVLKDQSEGV